MNAIRKINDINLAELENGTSDDASWHYDYRDSPYIFIGGLPFDIQEPDILIIFSQYGVITHLKLVKDPQTGKSKGFAYLRYHNYQSCVLAIDNFNGIQIFDRFIKVDHVYYSLRDGEVESDFAVDFSIAKCPEIESNAAVSATRSPSKLLEMEPHPSAVPQDDDFTDPMKAFDEFADPMLAFDELADPVPMPRKRHRKHGESSRKHKRNDITKESKHDEEKTKTDTNDLESVAGASLTETEAYSGENNGKS